MAVLHPHRHLDLKFWIIGGSILINAVLWYGLSQGANQVATGRDLPEITVERVTVEKENPTEHKKVVLKPIPPKPPIKPLPPTHKVQPPPEMSHNKVITAKPSPTAHGPAPFSALAGGNHELGAPTSGQGAGNAVVSPPVKPPVVAPTITPVTTTPPETRPVTTSPPTAPPVGTPPPPPPPPPSPPKPKGPTSEASPSHQEDVQIPDSLKSQGFKSFVRVMVNIAADGSFTVTLRTSSGNTDVDKLVLATLNRWKWKPALKDGDPVDSVQRFRFNFSIE